MRFLHIRPTLFSPGEEKRAEHGSGSRRRLYTPTLRIKFRHAGSYNTQCGNLGNRQEKPFFLHKFLFSPNETKISCAE